MSIVNSPPTTAVDTLAKNVLGPPSEGWRNFFVGIYNVCNALTQSGTTANRPASLLWTGRMYWDTTLGYAVWYKAAGVWVNSAGAPV